MWTNGLRACFGQPRSNSQQGDAGFAQASYGPRNDSREPVTEDRYRLSFTSGGLLVREAGVAAALYQQQGDWSSVRGLLESENLLQVRTVSTGQRRSREVVQRLIELTDDEVDLLVDASSIERGYLMWAAACRRYALLGEFAEEVLRERFLVLAPSLDYSDFDSFVRTKAVWHNELAELKESTYRKLRTNVFLMLREAGLLGEYGHINPVLLTDRLSAAFGSMSRDIRFFPASDSARSGGGR